MVAHWDGIAATGVSRIYAVTLINEKVYRDLGCGAILYVNKDKK